MLESRPVPAPTVASSSIESGLFMWRGDGILLIGERDKGQFVLARSWLHGDRLAHVRRWTFREPIPFSGQVRRLVLEACKDHLHARDQGLNALAWAETSLE